MRARAQTEQKAAKKAEEDEVKKKQDEEEKRQVEEAKQVKRKKEEEAAKKKAEARRKAQEEAEKQRKIELEADEKRQATAEAQRREKEDKEEEEKTARREEEDAMQRQASGAGLDKEQTKQWLIKRIMRDDALSHQEKQLHVQAIWAGKVDVVNMSASYKHTPVDSKASAPDVPAHKPKQGQTVAGAGVGSGSTSARAQAGMAYNEVPVLQSQHRMDLDMEAVALSAMGAATGLGIDEDDIMAMALGTMDPPHQEWNASEAMSEAMPPMSTSNYHDNSPSFASSQSYHYEPFTQGANTGFNDAAFNAASYDPAAYDPSAYEPDAYDDAGSATGSRLFERWAGQGLGGGPANSRLGAFVNDASSAGYANGFNGQYGFGNTDPQQQEPTRLPLGSRRGMH